ncbi:hypothetical protein P7K49_021876 [Saguinus oedipus]|uniref:Uncharacterized protein n=1 Tax=Saguinus oedipus TaxID=9490 RepID=A0ABQ9UTW3_SAGOE|nr:hypothetical protein P7K49_021876 [Saguinus oedipus]
MQAEMGQMVRTHCQPWVGPGTVQKVSAGGAENCTKSLSRWLVMPESRWPGGPGGVMMAMEGVLGWALEVLRCVTVQVTQLPHLQGPCKWCQVKGRASAKFQKKDMVEPVAVPFDQRLGPVEDTEADVVPKALTCRCLQMPIAPLPPCLPVGLWAEKPQPFHLLHWTGFIPLAHQAPLSEELQAGVGLVFS